MIPCTYVLPFIYLSADKKEQIYIITPWININVILPQIGIVIGNFKTNEQLSLIEFLKAMREYKGINTIVILKGIEETLNHWSYQILTREDFKVYIDSKVHLKAILSSKWVYTGSANITEHGLYENKENCEIGRALKNPEKYLKEWGIKI